MVQDPNNAASWDPVTLTYAVDGEEVELPLRLLLVGRFSTNDLGSGGREPKPVTPATLDAVIADMAPELTLTVRDCLVDDERSRDLVVRISCMDDFLPGSLVVNVPELTSVLELIEAIRAGDVSHLAAGDDHFARLLDDLGWHEEGGDRIWVDYAIAELSDRLSGQLDEVLHHPAFQELESNWRNVNVVLSQCDEDQCRIDLLDVSAADLAEDFRTATDLESSLLYWTIHAREFGQYGGEPYAAVIAAFQFGPSAEDIELLRSISRVCAWAHSPFLAGASPALFGLEQFDELAEMTSLLELKRAPRLAKWWSFVEEESSRYVALTVPRVLLRAPYDGQDGSSGFAYQEAVASNRRHCLWGVAAFGLAECLVRSFRRFRVCFDITGPSGGRVWGLPARRPQNGRQDPSHTVEAVFPEGREAELTELGFIPVNVARAHDYVVFNSAHSLHAAVAGGRVAKGDRDDLGTRLGTQLPYLFLASRVAHYLKVIQRDMIGTLRTEAEMQTELDAWLRRYVSDVDNPSPDIRARRPLRTAQLEVADDAGDGTAYRMHLQLVPHTRYLNAEFSLSLEGRLGRA